MTLLNTANALRLGAAAADAAYLGADLVWSAGSSPGGGAVATVTVPAATVGSTLTGFVTRVNLADLPSDWWSAGASDGSEIRVKQAGTVIPFDVVWYDAAMSAGELYFKATLTTGSNVFTVEQVSGAAALAPTDTNGRNAVWSDYDVFVCGAPGATSFINRVDGTAFALVGASLPTGLSDGWMDFGTGVAGHIVLTGLAQRSVYTLGVSTYSQESGTSNRACLSYTQAGSTSTGPRVTFVDQSGDTRGVWNSADGWRTFGTRVLNSPERRVATFDGSTQMLVYLNGALALTDNGIAVRPTASPCELDVGGGVQSSSERWQGRLNRAYLRGGLLSADWVAAEDTSWETPASFYAIS